MRIPDYLDSTGMIIDGCAATECIDTSGESIKIEGVGCSQFEDEDSGILCNSEHAAPGQEELPEDIKSEDTHIYNLGKVIYYKKIFKEDDCENERQRLFFEKVHKYPYVYVICRLFDGSGHLGALATAAHLRDNLANGEPLGIRFSIEGGVLERNPSNKKIIEQCIWKKLACTFRPANKTAYSGILLDPNNPKQELRKAEFQIVGESLLNQTYEDLVARVLKQAIQLRILSKALTAGNYDVAPSNLTGGAALQKEHVTTKLRAQVMAAVRDYPERPFHRDSFKSFAKSKIPDVSNSFLEHFADLAQDLHIQKQELQKQELQKTEPDSFTVINRLYSNLVDLRKAAEELAAPTPPQFPKVFQMSGLIGGGLRPIGRFMITPQGETQILEDHHGQMQQAMTPGIMDVALGRVSISTHTAPDLSEGANGGDLQPEPLKELPVPLPAAVFEYTRPGFQKPHLIEFGPHGAALDGKHLMDEELALIHSNVASGLATLRYKSMDPGTNCQYEADTCPNVYCEHNSELFKAEGDTDPGGELDPGDALSHVRAAVKAGHVHPSVERALTKHIYEDPMTPGIGNKYAYEKFKAQKKQGIYLMHDGNSFKTINDTYGHDKGDQVIKHIGNAMRTAADRVGGIKTHRVGGDEFSSFAPTHEHAVRFMREFHNEVDKIPHVNGVHKVSISTGMGHSPEHADKSLYHAKDTKKGPDGSSMYPIEKIPNLAHSLVQGHEGPIPQPNEHSKAPAIPVQPQAI